MASCYNMAVFSSASSIVSIESRQRLTQCQGCTKHSKWIFLFFFVLTSNHFIMLLQQFCFAWHCSIVLYSLLFCSTMDNTVSILHSPQHLSTDAAVTHSRQRVTSLSYSKYQRGSPPVLAR